MSRRMAALVALPLLVGGCSLVRPTPPQQTLAVSNPGYKVDLLFKDPNGASIYRFYDQGDYRYYIVGPGDAHMLPTTHTVDNSTTDIDTVFVDNDHPGDHGDHGGGGGGGHHH